jgi:hypothetical protein
MIAAIDEATFAAVIAGLISGGVVLLGVILAESLKRQGDARKRRFVLVLTGRSLMDQFVIAVEAGNGRLTVEAQDLANALMEHVIELQTISSRRSLLYRKRRRRRSAALRPFLIKLSALRVRLMIDPPVLRREEVNALKEAMVAYEAEFGAGSDEQARQLAMHYVENGIDSEPPGDDAKTTSARGKGGLSA